MQRLAVDEIRAQPRQITLGKMRKSPVKHQSDGAVEHAVADEFQPLVVLGRKTPVREREAQQLRAAKGVTERGAFPSYLLADALKSSRRLTLPNR
jgi:hypothetical protein